MLCRRCGMESSTEDVCEWCKRPMLPAGAKITGQRQEVEAGEASAGRPDSTGEGGEGGAPLAEESASEREQAEGAEQVLRPLGGRQAARAGEAEAPETPSHGLSKEATRTSVDVSQYTGDEESLFRPMERPDRKESLGGADPLARRRRRDEAEEAKSEISDNVRLLRSAIAGVIISVFLALVQLIVTRTMEDAGTVPNRLVFASVPLIRDLGQSGSLRAVLMYGVLMGLLMGLGLGAVLVRFKRGPFVGMLVGLLVGYGLLNGAWGYLCGALTGIACGIIATAGIKQVARV